MKGPIRKALHFYVASVIIKQDGSTNLRLRYCSQVLICSLCDNQAPTKSSVKIHKQAEHDEIPFACNQCELKLRYSEVLRGPRDRHEVSI